MADESELIRAAARGDVAAKSALFERHWRRSWRIAYAITGDRQQSEDVVQGAFERAFRSLDRFDLGRSFAPWLNAIVANGARDLLRRRRREIPVERPYGDFARATEPADWELVELVAALPKTRRSVLVLHYWLGFSGVEIAELLDVPVGTVNSRISRALDTLREQMEVPDAHT
jgi:RNA polymerase sigma-70 factor, ECF subfamily